MKNPMRTMIKTYTPLLPVGGGNNEKLNNKYIYQGSWEGMQSSVLILLERVTLMSTYEEFMVILTVAMLIVAILNYKK